ncbi:DUF434 domain-containing protein [Flavobacterium sp. RHBU_3]|uniref:DUF434 domain-containing protein n=1 Tax=Flavobacterium sp. RHBU_3 TaxID=3391184 RepID=UPI0039855875
MEQEPTARRSRGKSSEDDALFGNIRQQDKLREALQDMYYLLSRDYPVKASLILTGNRYRLKTRQIIALQGMACSAQDIALRQKKALLPHQLEGKTLYLDGFNILIVLETLLSGGYVFKGLDGCYRDISSVHGTYKRVQQTEEVLTLAGNALQQLNAARVVWVFDQPVSNSGKMKALCYETAEQYGYKWDAILDNSPDKFLAEDNRLVSSSDAWVLNECYEWFNLTGYIVQQLLEQQNNFSIIAPEIVL